MIYTGKSLSEPLIFASTNPEYDDRLFIELQVQYIRIPSSEHENSKLRTCQEHAVYTNCFCFDIQNNLFSYFELIDLSISASDKE